MRRVKVVCTLGPATAGRDAITRLLEAGMDVVRLNFSHGDHESHRDLYNQVRAAAAALRRPVTILGDLAGPKIRVGKLTNGEVILETGQKIALTTDAIEGSGPRIPQSYGDLTKDVRTGEIIYFDDGQFEVQVESIIGNDVICTVKVGGVLKEHKGMNLPGTKLSTPALTEKDRGDIRFGLDLGVDYFALSFVRTANDVTEAKMLAGDIPLIAKIEKPEGVANLEAIIDACDGVMVARGDLGIEAGYEKVPLIQKRMISDVKSRAKPVITATQMLDSMIHNPEPTRAEVSDVANAVLDGTDAVMLSGETAIGMYPIEAVRMMVNIINEVESSDYYATHLPCSPKVREKTFSNVTAGAASEMSREMNLAAIAVYTVSGRSAALVSAHRPRANVIAFSPNIKVLNWLALFWGIMPLQGEWVNDVSNVVDQAENELLKHQLVKPGERIAIVFGLAMREESFQTNMIGLWDVR